MQVIGFNVSIRRIYEIISCKCRDYDVSSERRDGVEEFYRINHIYQSVDFVNNQLLIWFFFDFLIRSLLYVLIGWMFNN